MKKNLPNLIFFLVIFVFSFGCSSSESEESTKNKRLGKSKLSEKDFAKAKKLAQEEIEQSKKQ